MANRHLSRSIILQTLFEWDFRGNTIDIKEVLTRDTEEFAPGLDDMPFMMTILGNIEKKRVLIDEIIEKAAPEWPIDKINAVDRNILRMGLAELLFGDRSEVPPKVAINEAIELAKTFGGENSSKFINGVLGAVYKEIGEPGKNDTSKKKKPNEPVDLDALPIEQKAGAVVYARHEGQIYFALVHDVFGYWTLSKGGVEKGEDAGQAAVREIKEEINLTITIKEKLGESEYIANHPTDGKIRKHVTFFLAESAFEEVVLEESGGLDGAKWFQMEELGGLKIYDDITGLLAKSIAILTTEKED